MQAKRWQRGPSSATSTLPQAGQNSNIAGPAPRAAPSASAMAEAEEELAHAEVLELFQAALARLVQDPLLCDLPPQVGPGLGRAEGETGRDEGAARLTRGPPAARSSPRR